MKKLLSENILVILTAPVLINYLFNLYQSRNNLIFFYIDNKFHFFSLLLSSAFFYFISKEIKVIFKINSLCLALSYFLTSFFLIDFLFMFVNNFIDLGRTESHNFVLLSWLFLLIYKKIRFNSAFFLIISYSVLVVSNNYFYEKIKFLGNYIELNTDVNYQWFELSEKLYSQGLFEAFTNNVIEGQGLYLSYIQSLIFKLNFPLNDFEFIRVNSGIFLIFAFFIFFDLKIKRKNKYLISILFFTVILNSDWLSYLFIDSLMLEGIASFTICSFLINFKKYENKNIKLRSFIYFLFFGCLLMSKQFISTIALLFIIYSLFVKRNINSLASFFIYFLNRFYLNYFVGESSSFEYLDGRNVTDLLFDLITLNNLDFSVIKNIIDELLKDRIVSFLFIVFILLNLINIYQKNKSDMEYFYVVLLNLIFINILYISWWKNIEIQSSYRYFLNFLHVLFVSIAVNSNKLPK